MIGVDAHPAEHEIVREFFELLKTPWEIFSSGKTYDVVLSTREFAPVGHPSPLLLHFFADDGTDGRNRAPGQTDPSFGSTLSHAGLPLPIYGPLETFRTGESSLLIEVSSRVPAIAAQRSGPTTSVRIGYNLFREVEFLLTEGQAVARADIPTLERHLALLRDLITRAGLPLAEIPPAPADAPYLVCLTHDIDHPVMRRHRWDHTMAGFLARTVFVAPLNWLRRRVSFRDLLRHWAGAARLPLVHFGLIRDPWQEFAADYLATEEGLGATYFFIPEPDQPGRRHDGPAPAKRAARYSLADVRPQLQRIAEAGNEIALHGLDAWRDASSAAREHATLCAAAESTGRGVRMHWLYFDRNSPRQLESAGFSYDSTFGYNATIGYRAGTAQAFQPPGCERLLELPLHVMDTALFYPSYLNLTPDEAKKRILQMLAEVAEHGGALTFNWHDRSLYPDRLWGTAYLEVVAEMKRRGAWFPTAAEAVEWFRHRRAVSFTTQPQDQGRLAVCAQIPPRAASIRGLKLRLHLPCRRGPEEALASGPRARWLDQPLAPSLSVSYQN
jgi:hypothetical protein